MKNNRDLEFLYEIGSLKNVPRGWRQYLATDVASVLEHILRVTFLALIIARKEGVKNEEKILKMSLAHDIFETRISEITYVPRVYVKPDDAKAAKDMFEKTSLRDFKEIIAECRKGESIEAKIVKDADWLDIDLELKELEEKGHKYPKKWNKIRKMVRDKKFHTKSAKKLWDEIQNSDPATWHLKINKFAVKYKHNPA